MPLKVMLLHIGEKDTANAKVIEQMRNIGSTEAHEDIAIPETNLLVHISDVTLNIGEKPVIQAKSGCGAGAILMYDTTRANSLANCCDWIDAFRGYACSEAIVLLLADRSYETFTRERKVSKQEGEMFAKSYGVLYREVDTRKPDSAQEALGHLTYHIYKKIQRGDLGKRPSEGVKPIKNPPTRRHTTSCASPIDPPVNSFPGRQQINGNGFSLEDSIPELVAIKSQLSAAEEEVVRMKERETSLQQQHKQLCSENSELGLDLVAAKREIETLKIKNVTLQREKHSLAEQLTQTEDEVQRLNSEMFSLQQNCATLQQSSSHCSSLEQEKQGLSEALRDQAHESAKVQWQLQQQLTLKGEALDGEVKKHTETRAALRNTQLALDQMREENHRLRQSQGSAEIEDHWRISRNEVVINQGVVLGSGAWGNVAEGQFRGKKVAVKCLHEQIVASQTLDRVHREIRTMASIRHPNIVLFVAAVLDTNGQPLIISELLDTSLRRAYETHQLSGTVTKLEILHGVACALNYLHKLHQPIIHRDVSSANVLLKAAGNDKWTPKLSDFGSANLAQSSQTLGEGAIIYSAPETFPDCSNSLSQPHTTKIDVYSFGVLIGELLTEQLPNPKSLPSTLETVEAKWPLLHTLMVNCTKRNLLHRPDMDTVIAEISATLFDGTS